MEPYIWAILIAGLISSDTTSGPQILVAEPLVSCTIAEPFSATLLRD